MESKLAEKNIPHGGLMPDEFSVPGYELTSPPAIKEYRLVNESDRFEKKINKLIQEGFQPHGSLVMVNYGGYYQPMVKYV
jgi:hypothetical protein